DPNVDAWGFWQKLVPFENVYDNKVVAFSAFTTVYCAFTPTDAGTAPPSPRGYHETLCFPQGAWANCGAINGTTTTNLHHCKGQGALDASGIGTWVRTSFDLNGFAGQRIRVRWIAETWNFDSVQGSYFEVGGGFGQGMIAEDGWWIDDVTLTGAITTQISATPDTRPPPGSTGGGASSAGGIDAAGDPCNEAVGDAGTSAALDVTDIDNRPLDGVTVIPVAGQTLRISAGASTLPGGCAGGNIEYEIRRNGVVIQDFSPKPFVLDAPDATVRYSARVRCSSDHACTSIVGAARNVGVITGDGGDVVLGAWGSPFDPGPGVFYDVAAATTTLKWWTPDARRADVYRGRLGPGITRGSYAAPFWRLDTSGAIGSAASCLVNDVGGTPETPPPAGPGGTRGTFGPLNQIIDPNPAAGAGYYYLVAADAPGAGSTNAPGCANPAICSHRGWCNAGTRAGAPCDADTDCAGLGACVIVQTFCHTSAGSSASGGCGGHAVCAGGSNAAHLCQVDGDCPGALCTRPPDTLTTPGSICLNQTGALTPPPPAGALNTECPPPGSPTRVVRQVVTGALCP
ncbi:MAG TPA: hypothetical protein VFB49_01345, partial [Patescibacteria group bacterium]|nr:hypothetical protein [Patescibacteria group bacterium]